MRKYVKQENLKHISQYIHKNKKSIHFPSVKSEKFQVMLQK
jgi:hypothetical protein